MSNSYFQFKKFKIIQDNCAMKVSTDACIQGAWAAINYKANNILDIGTGTGLLSLMMAQKNKNANITALEIDKDATIQAIENVSNNKCEQQICVLHKDLKKYFPETLFDFIICNPPFFENDLQTNSTAINLAKHSIELTLAQLIQNINRLLQNEGAFCLLLPFYRKTACEIECKKHNFYLQKSLHIKHNSSKKIKNAVLLFSNKMQSETIEELIIKNQDNSYSSAMQELLQDYYLHF